MTRPAPDSEWDDDFMFDDDDHDQRHQWWMPGCAECDQRAEWIETRSERP